MIKGLIEKNQTNRNNNFNESENLEESYKFDVNNPNINLNPYKTITNSSIKDSKIDENNRRTLQARISKSINFNKFKKSIHRNNFNNRSISPNSNEFLNYNEKYKVNKFINQNITLSQLFSGDIDDIITLNFPINEKRFLNATRYERRIPIGNFSKHNINSYKLENNSDINQNIKVPNKNPFLKKGNISYSINLRNQKPVAVGDSITLRELFNGEVEDRVTITKNNININSISINENLEEKGDNFEFPDSDDIKSLNEISSTRIRRQLNNKNNDTKDNINTFNMDDIDDLID